MGKQNEIRNDVTYNRALRNQQAPRRPIPTWADLSHDIATYAKEIDWNTQENDPSAETRKPPEMQVRVVKHNLPEKKERSNQPNPPQEQRNELWRSAIALGIPRSA